MVPEEKAIIEEFDAVAREFSDKVAALKVKYSMPNVLLISPSGTGRLVGFSFIQKDFEAIRLSKELPCVLEEKEVIENENPTIIITCGDDQIELIKETIGFHIIQGKARMNLTFPVVHIKDALDDYINNKGCNEVIISKSDE